MVTSNLLYFVLYVGQHRSSTLYKHKRSFPAPSPSIPSLHATLIDSLGNAGAEISFPTFVSYLEESGEEEGRDLSVKHAAVKALRSYSSEEVCVCVCVCVCVVS